MGKKYLRIAVVLSVLLFFFLASHFDLWSWLTLERLKAEQSRLAAHLQTNPVRFSAIYFIVYVISAAISLPGAAILTLAGGAIFGLGYGTLLVSFASTLGASLAFLLSRFVLGEWVRGKFATQFERIDKGIKNEGPFYLFSLRLIPLFPFFLVNAIMGLTSLPLLSFAWVSQIGMLPGTIAYVNAGTQLAKVDSLKGILSPPMILSFIALGILPWVAKKVISRLRNRKNTKHFPKPKRFDYNVVAIGAGAAGLVTSYIAAAVKAKVALIEKNRMGGECLNVGCVPSKALIRSAKLRHDLLRASEFGITDASGKVDFRAVMERVQKVITQIAPHDSVERYSKLGVDCFLGEARFLSPYTVEINGPSGKRTISARNFVVATGSTPVLPEIPGLESVQALNSDSVWDLRELPKRLLVLGGGAIGCELAQAFQRLGSEVTLVERGDRLLGKEDPEVSASVEENFASDGIHVRTGFEAKRFESNNGQHTVEIERAGTHEKIGFDRVLVCLGRKARVEGFGLEELGVKLTEQGGLEVTPFMETTQPNIYACGDVAGPYQFTHMAAHQAWYAAVNALFSPFKKFAADYRVIPWVTFTDPEVARLGLSETEAKKRKIPYELTRYGIDDLDRAIVDGNAKGFIRVLTPPGSDRILGVTIVGAHAGDLLTEFTFAMKWNLGLKKILGTIHPYPTYSEANKYLTGNWQKNHVPTRLLRWLERFHAFRRG